MARDLGIATESLRRWLQQADTASPADAGESEEPQAAAQRERGTAPEQRDSGFGVGFFRGQARLDTMLMIAYVDAHRARFGVGPICRTLRASLDCGFLTPRAYRRAKVRAVSRMRARHAALARDIETIHAHRFMAVYGYRKMHALLIRQGRTGIGRDQVLGVMRSLGIQGVRRGRIPVTTRPARGAGGRGDLVRRRFVADAPGKLHVADITYVRLESGLFAYVAFVTDAYARRIVGWAVSASQKTRALPLVALDQSITWTTRHGDTRGPVHHSDHGTQYISTLYGTHLEENGILASTGTVDDSYDNALVETVNGAYKTELIRRSKPFETVQALETGTFQWVSWWNNQRLHQHLGYRTPAEVEARYYQTKATPVTQQTTGNKTQSTSVRALVLIRSWSR